MKRAYYYLFYKLYKIFEAAPSRWLSDWKASLAIDVLLLYSFTSLVNYYKVFFNPNSHIGEGNLLFVVFFIISFSNYFIFHHKDKWKEIFSEYENLPEPKNKLASWVTLTIILISIINFIYSFYLFYQL